MTTPSSTAHERYDELAAGYALHALEPDEELEFTAHLAGCAQCQQGLDEHTFVAAQLGGLAETEAEEASPPSWQQMRAAIVRDEPALPVDLAARRRTPRRPSRLLAAAAAVVALAGVGLVAWQSTDHGGGGTTAAAAAIGDCRHRIGCTFVRLHADGGDPAVVIVDGGRVQLVPVAMKAPAQGKAYVLWQLPRSNGPTALGEFTDASRGMTGSLVTPYADTAAFAVSVERAGVTHAEPTQVVAVGSTT